MVESWGKELTLHVGAILTAVVNALPHAKVSALTRNSAHDSTLTAAGVVHVHHTETTDSEVRRYTE